MHLEVMQHVGAPPVVARHEQRLEGGRAAGSRLRRHGEDHPATSQVSQRRPHRGGGLHHERRPGPAGGVGVRQTWRGVPVLLEAGGDHQRAAAELAPVAQGHAQGAGVDGHDPVLDPGAVVRHHGRRRSLQRVHRRLTGTDVVEQRSVTVHRLRLHQGHVAGSVAQQLGGQRDPGVAAPDDQHLVVLHAVLRLPHPAGPTTVTVGATRGQVPRPGSVSGGGARCRRGGCDRPGATPARRCRPAPAGRLPSSSRCRWPRVARASGRDRTRSPRRR